MVGICRLCAVVRKVASLVNITDPDLGIINKLQHCCHIDITLSEHLPNLVCRDCIAAVDSVYDFYIKVKESQETLEALFAPKEVPPTKTTTLLESLRSNPVPLHPGDEERLDENYEETIEVLKTENGNEGAELVVVDSSEAETFLSKEENELIEEVDDELLLIEKILKKKRPDENFNEKNGAVSDECATNLNGQDTIVIRKVELEQKHLVEVEEIEKYPPSGDLEEVVECDADNGVKSKSFDMVDDDERATSETWSEYPWDCYLCCGLQETSFMDLYLHFQVEHDIQSKNDIHFKCIDCQKVCERYNNFLNHVRFRHRSELRLRCDICDECCSDYKELALHRCSQHPANDTEHPTVLHCTVCGHVYANANSLYMHSKTHQKKNDEIIECRECGKHFKDAKSLKAHTKLHSNVKEFSCEHCGKPFHQKINLDKHLLTHTTAKNFICPICGKTFKTSINLRKHNNIHTNTKSFKCSYCDKRFRTKESQLSHERTHTGEMPYKCTFCSRRFRFRSTFLGHLNTHTGKRPHVCIPCDHHFTNWSNYNKHMKRRHAAEYALKKENQEKLTHVKTERKMVDDNAFVEAMNVTALVEHEDSVYTITAISFDDTCSSNIEIVSNTETNNGA